jgi:hypothetical protein
MVIGMVLHLVKKLLLVESKPINLIGCVNSSIIYLYNCINYINYYNSIILLSSLLCFHIIKFFII